MSEVLPNGWVETSLKDIVTYKKGRKNQKIQYQRKRRIHPLYID
jgi:hypothetical protein